MTYNENHVTQYKIPDVHKDNPTILYLPTSIYNETSEVYYKTSPIKTIIENSHKLFSSSLLEICPSLGDYLV